MIFYYCYLYKRLRWKQELLVVSSRRTTALDYLCQDHYMNRLTGELDIYRLPKEANQPTIDEYLEQRALNLA